MALPALLTAKIFGIPSWGVLGGAAVGAYLLTRGSGSKSGSQLPADAAGAPTTTDWMNGYQSGYAQGASAITAGPTGPAGPAGPAARPAGPVGVSGRLAGWRGRVPPATAAANPSAQGRGVPPGVGGGGRSRGSRSADPMAYFHPSMKQSPRYLDFARWGMGGAGHQVSMQALAAQTGLHPARLLMLNSPDTASIQRGRARIA